MCPNCLAHIRQKVLNRFYPAGRAGLRGCQLKRLSVRAGDELGPVVRVNFYRVHVRKCTNQDRFLNAGAWPRKHSRYMKSFHHGD
ncbi:MAG: hypothetical protein ACK56I_00230, partial [bacterium]